MLFAEFKLILLGEREEIQFYSCAQLQFRKYTGEATTIPSFDVVEHSECNTLNYYW